MVDRWLSYGKTGAESLAGSGIVEMYKSHIEESMSWNLIYKRVDIIILLIWVYERDMTPTSYGTGENFTWY